MSQPIISLTRIEPEPSSTGMDPRLGALLAALFGIVFVFIETQNRFIRYLSVLSMMGWLAWFVTGTVLGVLSMMPFLGGLFYAIGTLLGTAFIVSFGLFAYLSFNHQKVVIRRVSDYAEKWSEVVSDDDQSD